MCENLDPNRVRCDVCRTINLAKTGKGPKPDMQIYDKCTPVAKICPQAAELRISPTCIKVCTKEEYKLKRQPKPIVRMPYYVHGKLLYAVKAGILVGSIYFTYAQGVWGDQRDATECIRRWREYFKSINTRRPPVFDHCGNVISKESSESVIAPLYGMYKELITTCFAGVVKIPVVVKCAYFDYLEALRKKEEQDNKERKIRKNTPH